jgi:hypothetical protein
VCSAVKNSTYTDNFSVWAGKPDWITVVPLPDTFRGKYAQDIYACQKYTEEAKLVIQRGMASGGEVSK